jgi:D-alanyl-D-alanine carboxypeptidase
MKKLLTALSLILAAFNSSAASYALYDFSSPKFVVENNLQEIRPIASITKIITAITVLNSGVNLYEAVKVDGRSNGHVPKNVLMTRLDLMRAMLVSSDNRAAETLANHHPGGFNYFIEDANRYLNSHLLFNTRVVDSSGLLPGNVSTAQELLKLLDLIKDNPVIRSIAGERYTAVNAPKGKKTLTINLHNTNPEIFAYDNILISKTGYTNPAGRCVLMLIEKGKELYGVVVLGQKTVKERSKLVKELLSIEAETKPMPKIITTITDFDYFKLTNSGPF